MSFSHMIILGIIALIVIPPDKLPEMARQLAKILFDLKRSTDQILGDLKQDALFKPQNLIDEKIKKQLVELQNKINNPNQDASAATEPTTAHDVTHTTAVPTELKTEIEVKKNE